ncbi:protein adenylyltransferase SelO [Litoribacillus peritrichatus]|uniref:Protein nucleotidyltransferase YdiU n=1 Tax=Litoribacillus peritrichatus TaxID=718191 RepID=A0ABP7M8I4_9GAMM
MQFSNTYLNLGERFYQKVPPTPVKSPELFLWNSELADSLGFDASENALRAKYFSGNQVVPGSCAIATVYAGHQFGSFNPQLGDGRAHLLGEVVDADGVRKDVQLKGSGPSAFSRNGDGRCALGPAVREFIMSAAMKSLGVPTTECLAVVRTGEAVYRQTPQPGAVVTRVASSHLRVGTFQFFAAQGDVESLKALSEFAINRHYSDITEQGDQRYICFLDRVIEKQIELIVSWMRVGFIHGVMNTDNTAISGETIDYGPCAMMGVYDPETVFSSIDRNGRYAFGNQPGIANWNMARFAECLLLLVNHEDEQIMAQVIALVNGFAERYRQAYLQMMAGKLGIFNLSPADESLIEEILQAFLERKLDYTQGFDLLTKSFTSEAAMKDIKASLGTVFDQWLVRVNSQVNMVDAIEARMRAHNPVVIPRNHHLEAVLQASEESGSSDAANAFLAILTQPYQEVSGTSEYQATSEEYDRRYQTFCGT